MKPPGTLDIFAFGELGVRISDIELEEQPGIWSEAQNGEVSPIEGLGALQKRGGLAPLNTSALAGPVLAMRNVTQVSPFEPPSPWSGVLYVQVDEGATKPWYQTDDLATFTAAPATTLDAFQDYFPAWGGGFLFFISDAGSGDVLKSFDGTYVLDRIGASSWPTIGAAAFVAARDLAFRTGTVYVLCEYDDNRSYVLAYRVSTGVITVLGSGPVAAVANQTPLRMLVTTSGQCYVAVVSQNGVDSSMYRFDLSGSGPWVNEANFESPFPVAGTVTALAEYNGVVYGAIQESGQPPVIVERDTSAWTNVSHDFSPATVPVLWLRPLGTELLAGLDDGSNSEVWVFDGATWSLDKDILTDFSVHLLSAVIVGFNDVLVVGADDDTLLSRTEAGVWAQTAALAGPILMLGRVSS
jgi:hypothetical protein